MTDTTIVLIAPVARIQDANGIWHTRSEQRREIFAQMSSIDRSEFFAAGQNGLRPEYRFTVFAEEYSGESACSWNGELYAIYRTYQIPGTDSLELYVQKKAGVHNAAQDDH